MHASQQHPAPFVVGTDRKAVDRAYRPWIIAVAVAVVVELSLLIVGLIAIAEPDAPGSAIGLAAIVAPMMLALVGYLASLAHQWGGVRSSGQRLVADAGGMRVLMPEGVAVVPWQAAQAARIGGRGRGRRLVLQVDASAVQSDLSPRDRLRVERHGIAFGAVGSRPGLEAIADVIAHGTQGRVQAR